MKLDLVLSKKEENVLLVVAWIGQVNLSSRRERGLSRRERVSGI